VANDIPPRGSYDRARDVSEHPRGWIPSRDPIGLAAPTYVYLREDRIYEVVKSRVVALGNYYPVPRCCIVKDILTGEVFYAHRNDLVLACLT
jgi:hypothetical protein